MELAYKKVMAENNLTLEQLPEDAKIGVKEVELAANSIRLTETRKQTVKPDKFEKLKVLDKWCVREILDFVEGTNKNTNMPNITAKEIITGIEKDNSTTTPADTRSAEEIAQFELGTAIDAELKTQHDAGKVELTLAEIKTACPKAYAEIFSAYKEGEDNGVETTHYSLIELKDKTETYKLTKK